MLPRKLDLSSQQNEIHLAKSTLRLQSQSLGSCKVEGSKVSIVILLEFNKHWQEEQQIARMSSEQIFHGVEIQLGHLWSNLYQLIMFEVFHSSQNQARLHGAQILYLICNLHARLVYNVRNISTNFQQMRTVLAVLRQDSGKHKTPPHQRLQFLVSSLTTLRRELRCVIQLTASSLIT